jgi:hypothetical protein
MAWADHYETKIIFGFDAVFEASGYQLPHLHAINSPYPN